MTQPPYSSSWPDPSPPPGQPTPGPPPAQPQWTPPPGPPPFNPAGGPPGYGQVPPVPGYGYPPPAKPNSLALAAMIVSIASAVSLLCAFCFSLLAVVSLGGGVTGTILGFVARRQIRERGEGGDGMALAGIIVGLVAAGLGVLALVAMVLWFGYAFRNGYYS
jgi:hypothetical protein